tara:strand:- start:875 stop:1321 length:447 start_codon:yes stop_codon:yes gene_type:complete
LKWVEVIFRTSLVKYKNEGIFRKDMKEVEVNLDSLVPTQIHLNKRRLDEILKHFDAGKYKIPTVIKYHDKFLITNGHNSIYRAHLKHLRRIRVKVIENEDDFREYKKGSTSQFNDNIDGFKRKYETEISKLCEEKGVERVKDLKDHIW